MSDKDFEENMKKILSDKVYDDPEGKVQDGEIVIGVLDQEGKEIFTQIEKRRKEIIEFLKTQSKIKDGPDAKDMFEVDEARYDLQILKAQLWKGINKKFFFEAAEAIGVDSPNIGIREDFKIVAWDEEEMIKEKMKKAMDLMDKIKNLFNDGEDSKNTKGE